MTHPVTGEARAAASGVAAASPMSSGAAAAAAAVQAAGAGGGATVWQLRRRQAAAIVRLELRKSFLGRRAIGLWLLALATPAIFLLHAVLPMHDIGDIGTATQVMAHAYQDFILRVILFLGCVWIFGNLIRREVLDRSLHFYFLAPVRREVLLVAKYLAGLAMALVLFEITTLATFVFNYLAYDGRQRNDFLFHGPGMAHLGSYMLVTALACAGYGACFLALGFFFRSPALPALALFGWEAIHFLLPPFLKQLSVIHYLQALCPVPLSQGPFALLSDAPGTAASILGLLLLTVALVAVSMWRIRHMEVSYLDD